MTGLRTKAPSTSRYLSTAQKELQDCLRQMADYEKINADRDVIGLLKLIRGIAQKHNNMMYPTMSYT